MKRIQAMKYNLKNIRKIQSVSKGKGRKKILKVRFKKPPKKPPAKRMSNRKKKCLQRFKMKYQNKHLNNVEKEVQINEENQEPLKNDEPCVHIFKEFSINLTPINPNHLATYLNKRKHNDTFGGGRYPKRKKTKNNSEEDHVSQYIGPFDVGYLHRPCFEQKQVHYVNQVEMKRYKLILDKLDPLILRHLLKMSTEHIMHLLNLIYKESLKYLSDYKLMFSLSNERLSAVQRKLNSLLRHRVHNFFNKTAKTTSSGVVSITDLNNTGKKTKKNKTKKNKVNGNETKVVLNGNKLLNEIRGKKNFVEYFSNAMCFPLSTDQEFHDYDVCDVDAALENEVYGSVIALKSEIYKIRDKRNIVETSMPTEIVKKRLNMAQVKIDCLNNDKENKIDCLTEKKEIADNLSKININIKNNTIDNTEVSCGKKNILSKLKDSKIKTKRPKKIECSKEVKNNDVDNCLLPLKENEKIKETNEVDLKKSKSNIFSIQTNKPDILSRFSLTNDSRNEISHSSSDNLLESKDIMLSKYRNNTFETIESNKSTTTKINSDSQILQYLKHFTFGKLAIISVIINNKKKVINILETELIRKNMVNRRRVIFFIHLTETPNQKMLLLFIEELLFNKNIDVCQLFEKAVRDIKFEHVSAEIKLNIFDFGMQIIFIRFLTKLLTEFLNFQLTDYEMYLNTLKMYKARNFIGIIHKLYKIFVPYLYECLKEGKESIWFGVNVKCLYLSNSVISTHLDNLKKLSEDTKTQLNEHLINMAAESDIDFIDLTDDSNSSSKFLNRSSIEYDEKKVDETNSDYIMENIEFPRYTQSEGDQIVIEASTEIELMDTCSSVGVPYSLDDELSSVNVFDDLNNVQINGLVPSTSGYNIDNDFMQFGIHGFIDGDCTFNGDMLFENNIIEGEVIDVDCDGVMTTRTNGLMASTSHYNVDSTFDEMILADGNFEESTILDPQQNVNQMLNVNLNLQQVRQEADSSFAIACEQLNYIFAEEEITATGDVDIPIDDDMEMPGFDNAGVLLPS